MAATSFWTGKTVLITGGTGFVGHHLTRRLQALGVEPVIAVGRRDVDLVVTEEVMRWATALDRRRGRRPPPARAPRRTVRREARGNSAGKSSTCRGR